MQGFETPQADELTVQGYPVRPRTVAKLLREAGYRLQANAKTLEGRQHPDRDGQFDICQHCGGGVSGRG
jgi:hypothetical protein